jgi:hypothetical protein
MAEQGQEQLATNEKTLLVRIRMKGTTSSSRTSWDDDATRKVMDVMHNTSAFLAPLGWTASIESVEVLQDDKS